MAEKLLTEGELCELLKISKPTAWRWRREGMPFYRHGSTVRYSVEKVLKWLETREDSENDEEE